MKLLGRLGSADFGWVIGRSFVPRIAVLLAPAAASLDMFANYAARGIAFRSAVNGLVSS